MCAAQGEETSIKGMAAPSLNSTQLRGGHGGVRQLVQPALLSLCGTRPGRTEVGRHDPWDRGWGSTWAKDNQAEACTSQ